MSDLIIPTDSPAQEEPETVLRYTATEEDEEIFFLMYHMQMAPSEVERMKPDYRKWVIARFVAQKNMEREMMERQHLRSALGPDLKNGLILQ